MNMVFVCLVESVVLSDIFKERIDFQSYSDPDDCE